MMGQSSSYDDSFLRYELITFYLLDKRSVILNDFRSSNYFYIEIYNTKLYLLMKMMGPTLFYDLNFAGYSILVSLHFLPYNFNQEN